MLRRRKAGEAIASICKSLGRTSKSCVGKYSVLTNPSFAPSARGQARPRIYCDWRGVVARALQQLGGRGTRDAVCTEVERMPGLLDDALRRNDPGHQTPKWRNQVGWTLSHCKEFEKTDETVPRAERAASKGRRNAGAGGGRVWVFHPELAPIERLPHCPTFKKRSAKELRQHGAGPGPAAHHSKQQVNYARALAVVKPL